MSPRNGRNNIRPSRPDHHTAVAPMIPAACFSWPEATTLSVVAVCVTLVIVAAIYYDRVYER